MLEEVEKSGSIKRPEEEALRLKTLAEEEYNSGNLISALNYAKRAEELHPSVKDLPEMLTAFKVLLAAAAPITDSTRDYYGILQIKRFCDFTLIQRQYKRLAIIVHPGKKRFPALVEAYKLVREAAHVLSNEVRRNEYDTRLRSGMASSILCSGCRLLHASDRKYLGDNNLVCPVCENIIKAKGKQRRSSARICERDAENGVKRDICSVGDVYEGRATKVVKLGVVGGIEMLKGKDSDEGDMTLSQLQSMLKKKTKKKQHLVDAEKLEGKEIENVREEVREKEEEIDKNVREEEVGKEKQMMNLMDRHLYDFGKDRTASCFKEGQVWVVYDDDDGMPRHYGLIVKIKSRDPFRVKLFWLRFQSNKDDNLLSWPKTGCHVSCGIFQRSRKVTFKTPDLFSHVLECEMENEDLYRIYPKQGTVWAMYKNSGPYDIVVCLNSYSDIHGLSIAYLENVTGFRTVYKRRGVGADDVLCLGPRDVRLLSHQIPAKKLSGEESIDLPKEDCWELDPAALNPQSPIES